MHYPSVVVRRRVYIRAVVHQELNDSFVAFGRSAHKRGPTGIVRGIYFSAGFQELATGV